MNTPDPERLLAHLGWTFLHGRGPFPARAFENLARATRRGPVEIRVARCVYCTRTDAAVLALVGRRYRKRIVALCEYHADHAPERSPGGDEILATCIIRPAAHAA